MPGSAARGRVSETPPGRGEDGSGLAVLTVAFAGALILIPFAAAAEITAAGPLTRILITPDLNCGVSHVGTRSPGVLRRYRVRHVARLGRCALRAGQHSCRRWGVPHNGLHAGQPDRADGDGHRR